MCKKMTIMMSTLICKCIFFLMLTLKAFSVPLPESSVQQIYLHPDMFKDNYCNVTPKDVGAFKFFCTLDYVSTIVNQHIEIFADEDPLSLENYFTNDTTICKEYADIKTYQFMMYQSLDHQDDDANISNITITSIIYLLQTAGESLQEIQYDNHQLYCPDYEEDIHILLANQTYGVASVLRTLYERNEYDWSQDSKYPELFNSSRHIQYRNGSKPLCQHYMSIFTTLMKIY